MATDLTAIQAQLNQIFKNPIRDQLNQRSILLSRLRKVRGGGKNIAWDVKVQRGTSAGSYAESANIVGDDNDIELPAVLPWKQNKAEFRVTGKAIAAAASNGPEAYAKLFTKSIMDATRNLGIELARQLYLDGTGNGGLDIDGLTLAVADTGTYAGISRVAYSVWRGNVLANGGVPRALTVDLMRLAERLVFTASGAPPDFIVTTPAILSKYEALFDNLKRVIAQNGNEGYDLGPTELYFKGVPVLRDHQCPAGHMWFLTWDSVALEQLPPVSEQDGIPLTDGEEDIETQDGDVGILAAIELLGKTGDHYKGFVKVYNNLAVEHPNRNAVIKDIDEA